MTFGLLSTIILVIVLVVLISKVKEHSRRISEIEESQGITQIEQKESVSDQTAV